MMSVVNKEYQDPIAMVPQKSSKEELIAVTRAFVMAEGDEKMALARAMLVLMNT